MDPKLSNLDPKLKEAYDRVMNGPAAQPTQTVTQNSAIPPTPTTQNPIPQNEHIMTPNSQAPQATINQIQNPPLNYNNPAVHATPPVDPTNPSFNPNPAINSTIAFNANNDAKNQGTSPVKKGHNAMLPIVIVVLISILVVVYAFVWAVIFDVQLPFIPAL